MTWVLSHKVPVANEQKAWKLRVPALVKKVSCASMHHSAEGMEESCDALGRSEG